MSATGTAALLTVSAPAALAFTAIAPVLAWRVGPASAPWLTAIAAPAAYLADGPALPTLSSIEPEMLVPAAAAAAASAFFVATTSRSRPAASPAKFEVRNDDLVLRIGRDGVILEAINTPAALGDPMREREFIERVHLLDRAALLRFLDEGEKQGAEPLEIRFLNEANAGRPQWETLRCSLTADDTAVGTVLHARNVSEIVALRAGRNGVGASEVDARLHKLANALTPLSGYAELAAEELIERNAGSQVAERLKASCTSARQEIRLWQAHQRLSQENGTIAERDVDVRGLVETIAEELAPVAALRGVALKFSGDVNLWSIDTDQTLLRACVTAAIADAVQTASEGSTIACELRPFGKKLELRVDYLKNPDCLSADSGRDCEKLAAALQANLMRSAGRDGKCAVRLQLPKALKSRARPSGARATQQSNIGPDTKGETRARLSA